MQRQFVGSKRSAALHKAAHKWLGNGLETRRRSGRAVVIAIVGDACGFVPDLDERHQEQIDRRGQADAARRLGGTRQIAHQLLELVSP